jgi:DNA-binding CsgD family transcriptional regulator
MTTLPLTKREIEVMQTVANMGIRYGYANKALRISIHTLNHHLRNVREKLNATHTANAVAIAWTLGWIK